MDFADVVAKRKMVRSYLPDPVDESVVNGIVRAAQRAPSAAFSQGIKHLVVTNREARSLIAEVVADGAWRDWLGTAPVHIYILVSEQNYHDRYHEPDKLEADGTESEWPVPYWYVDAGASLMLLLLAATDAGLGAGFCGPRVPEAAWIKDHFGIPADLALVGLVTVGRPAPDPDDDVRARDRRRRRRPTADVVHRERWQPG